MGTTCAYCGGEFSHGFSCLYYSERPPGTNTPTPTPTAKPATVEPPVWKGWAMPDILREQLAQPSTVVHEPSPLDRALEAFIERRKAKREINRADAPLSPADIRKRVARIKERYRGEELARAMSAPVSFSARMGGR